MYNSFLIVNIAYIKQFKPNIMKIETLDKANRLLVYIKEKETQINNLNKEIKALEQCEYNEFSLSTGDFSHGCYPREKTKVNFRMDKNMIIKLLKNDLYVKENLLRKYKLEFENLI